MRDPLLAFVVLGALVVAVHLGRRPPAPEARGDRPIVVTDADVAWLATVWEKTWQRPPTPAELRGLVENRIRQEVLVREAIALGLDREDEVVRRRLASKLEYLAQDVAGAAAPTEAELTAYYEANAERYETEGRRSFAQVYVNADDRGAEAEAHARSLLERLRAEDVDAAAAGAWGDRLLLESDLAPMRRGQVGALYGEAFADALFEVDVDRWEGPLRSGYGLHLVRVVEAHPSLQPRLEEVRDAVRRDLLDERGEQALEAFVRGLRERYPVEVTASGLDDAASRR